MRNYRVYKLDTIKVEDIMERRGSRYTWASLARDAKIAYPTLMYVLHRNGRKVSRDELTAIAEALGVKRWEISVDAVPGGLPPAEYDDGGIVNLMEGVVSQMAADYLKAISNLKRGRWPKTDEEPKACMRECERAFEYWFPGRGKEIKRHLREKGGYEL